MKAKKKTLDFMSAMGQKCSKPQHLTELRNSSDLCTRKDGKNKIQNQYQKNSDSQLVPDWIHKSQFIEILKENVPEFARIENFLVKPALSAGENYSSLMLRVIIDIKLTDKTIKPMSFMMKVPHESAKMQQMLKTVNFFTVENATYTELISKFEDIYKAKGVSITFAPRTYKFKESLKYEPKLANSVLMYDLSQDGYRNLNRMDCLNMEESKFVLRKLAQYHAAGAHCRVIHGPYSDVFTQPMFGSSKERALTILNGIMGPFKKMFLGHLKNFKDGDKYYDKFEHLFSKMSQKFLKLSTYDPNEFNVINHGDCWINNLLFKFGPNKELVDVIFVDFQLPKYGHPSTDLLNFIMTSVHIDLKLKEFDFFIKYYHDHLIEHLLLLGYSERMPTLKELHSQLYKYGIWAITASVMVLPIVLLDPNEEALEGAQFKNMLYTNSRYKTHIEKILPWLDNRGLLEE
ncbi:uncharacterized protein LOC117576831 isoform X1 [Drosophila albomicans]|uniref:Uncharacterized protein LOC117576831 isoform X1 n=2 Tax=Drosophila albomicans TaxID=7291 RepID=A0A6P8XMM9_DROAB|nr:uncharacterized protein LOC117576831 isoform X1 [Drosophila albomicans]